MKIPQFLKSLWNCSILLLSKKLSDHWGKTFQLMAENEVLRGIHIILGILFCSSFMQCISFVDQGQNTTNRPDTTYITEPQIVINKLPGKLHESSGLVYFNDLVWTINDSGGDHAIYGFNLYTGQIEQHITISNATNHDWEALADDEEYMYIGDFGNNWGNRRDLKIYKILKSGISETGNTVIDAEKIEFSYPGQSEFRYGLKQTPFDCEAFTSFGNKLYLFSKDWENYSTVVHALPKNPGVYCAEIVDTFSVNGLITGADISSGKPHLVLIGYKDY